MKEFQVDTCAAVLWPARQNDIGRRAKQSHHRRFLYMAESRRASAWDAFLVSSSHHRLANPSAFPQTRDTLPLVIPMSNESGSHLTTSRISRLLRPLRTKCKQFVEVANLPAKPHGGAVATYATASRHPFPTDELNSDFHSLTLLPPPKTLGSLTRLERPARDHFRLSKAIYDVRDAYCNIVQVAFGTQAGSRTGTPEFISRRGRVRGLASICASVIGEQIEEEARGLREQQDEPNQDEDMELLNDIYDAVPMHYRRYAVLDLVIWPH